MSIHRITLNLISLFCQPLDTLSQLFPVLWFFPDSFLTIHHAIVFIFLPSSPLGVSWASRGCFITSSVILNISLLMLRKEKLLDISADNELIDFVCDIDSVVSSSYFFNNWYKANWYKDRASTCMNINMHDVVQGLHACV